MSDPTALARLMTGIDCRGGNTQIGKVLAHVKRAGAEEKINAAVLVGDAFEESIDAVCAAAGEIGLMGIPMFMFLEGRDPMAERAFREIARLTGGAFCRLDAGSAGQLRELLSAVAVYAAGGRRALEDYATVARGQHRAAAPADQVAARWRSSHHSDRRPDHPVDRRQILRGQGAVGRNGAPGSRRRAACFLGGFLALRGGIAAAAPFLALGLGLLGKNLPLGDIFGFGRKTQGQKSRVKTRMLAMELDHDSGTMDGKVLEGEFRGRRLSELNRESLLRLLQACSGSRRSERRTSRGLSRPHAWRTGGRPGTEGAGPARHRPAR